ncbi:cytochrome d ubiquinol oxidase subunit II [Bacillus badius]|uniref:Cytochrome d ubiquinol oxidase subunit II n=1 Tax=Bacillus badius TaxID=1455 RepID=A0ABR5AUX7_BACBA|nr:cytochrome d ubiquinol oxidase subunit II [Bacillus badius]KIL76442.1 Cytochrome d ubiquinol oxidase subunit II [Bacillus badius]KIL78559.1 Cytochrome d ubiquinol oxidase subunit II [Bacillus badius]KZR58681.1 cytochrome D ubiquinol oxidase subunit II [Bacillus badius]MED4715979.1 cytochrome d ubiquinol oxidase subunit II [Bacillus badius]
MSLELLGISVLWIFLFGYLIVGSIDFGAGFFSLYSDWTGQKHILHKMIQRYLSPVWEVTNVFLVFFFVGIVGFFPKTAYYFGSALLVPASISIILLAIRGSYYAFGTYGSKENKVYSFIYGITGVLIPASLTTVLTISEGGFLAIDKSGVHLKLKELLTSPYSWSVVLVSLVSVLFISAAFLTYYARQAEDNKAEQLVRRYTLGWSIPSVAAGVLVFYALRSHNPEHFARMADVSWMFVASLVFFIAAITLFYKQRAYGVAFFAVVMQYFTAFLAYGISHYPYLLYPVLTIYDGFTNKTMAIYLVVAFIAGLLLLIPALYLLLKLFLFNRKYVKGME